MTMKRELMSRFSGETTGHPLFVPDLTLWYEWHSTRGSLPEAWQDRSLPEITRLMGVPAWLPAQLWSIETPGIAVRTTETADERTITYEMSNKTLVARWTQGPDDDWWQTEYPVRSEEDLEAAIELVESRDYVLAPSNLSDVEGHVGSDGIVALELPKRPYSELLHDLVGWSEGLLLLDRPEVEAILSLLESKLQHLVEQITRLPGEIVLSPDNLDGQFISPGAFERYLSGSYRRTAEILHDHGKQLVVHIGGPIKRLLSALAATGVDGIQGICGPPQSDASLPEARDLVGPEVTLWGGIPQDALLKMHAWAYLEGAIIEAGEAAAEDPRILLGVADRVPVSADIERLKAMTTLITETLPSRDGPN